MSNAAEAQDLSAAGTPARYGSPRRQKKQAGVRKSASAHTPPASSAEALEMTPARAPIVARYEAGDLPGALTGARRGSDDALWSRLALFRRLYDEGNLAARSGHYTIAIARLERALEVDAAISGGWGRYREHLRRELAELWLRVGLAHLDHQAYAGAQRALRRAVAHAPSHPSATTELQRVDALVTAHPRATIDDAFDGAILLGRDR